MSTYWQFFLQILDYLKSEEMVIKFFFVLKKSQHIGSITTNVSNVIILDICMKEVKQLLFDRQEP